MTYRIEFAKRAAKQFKSLSTQIQQRLREKIDALATNPRPPNVVKLTAENNLYRLRVGDYRVIYTIYEEEVLILVLKIGHRRDVYRS